jgi:hypothetical protein
MLAKDRSVGRKRAGGLGRVADPHHFNADPNPAFTFMRNRIQLLLKVLGICDHQSTCTSPPELHFEPPCLLVSVHGSIMSTKAF